MRIVAALVASILIACAASTPPPLKPLVDENGAVLPERAVRPKAIEKVELQVPNEIAHSKFNESVTLDVIIGVDGKVRTASYVKGDRNLIPAAIDALQKWRFEPATLDGKPVAVHYEWTVSVHSFSER